MFRNIFFKKEIEIFDFYQGNNILFTNIKIVSIF